MVNVSISRISHQIHCNPRRKLDRVLRLAAAKVGREQSRMMREFVYFCRTTIPWVPPFVVLVMIFMAVCLGLYLRTKSRGFLITFCSGFCYLIPWIVQGFLR